MTPQELGLPSKFQSFRTEIDQAGVIFQLASSPSPVSVLCAPPGAGKSPIYIGTSKLMALLADNPNFRTLILVKTKALEDQLLSEFSSIGMVGIRGHSNYSCADLSFGEDEELLDMQCSGRRGGICFYNEKVQECLSSNLVVTNNAHWFHTENCNDGGRLGRFDLIIIDEAHKVHNTLVDFVSIKLDESLFFRRLRLKLPKEFTYLTWSKFADKALYAVQDTLEDQFLSRKQQIVLEKLEKAIKRIDFEVLPSIDKWRMIPGIKGLTLSPVWGRDYAERFLFRGIPQSIFCSATINKKTPELFGIEESGSEYIEVGSSFEKQRRPFYYLPVYVIDYKISDHWIREVVRRIEELIETRTIALNWKGIIHSISYKWSDRIFAALKPEYRELAYIHNSRNAKDVIDAFRSESQGCVLISPIVQEGHDFADDLCRYQVIWKVPFVDSRDPLVEARAKEDKTYRTMLAIEAMEQMYGRPVRNFNDWAETYIFDKHWQHFRNQFGFHKWFRLAWRQVDRMPEPLNFD